MILFDEIERLSPGTGSSPHWRNGSDFVLFWQTLRGFYQRHQSVFTYMLVGTNPSCVEQSMIAGHENPLFGSIPSDYVPSFTVEQTREMVRKLGRYMGLHFDEMLYAKLVEDFGGHPFLIRQFCSEIHKACKGDRPERVDKALYGTVMTTFRRTAIDYLSMNRERTSPTGIRMSTTCCYSWLMAIRPRLPLLLSITAPTPNI